MQLTAAPAASAAAAPLARAAAPRARTTAPRRAGAAAPRRAALAAAPAAAAAPRRAAAPRAAAAAFDAALIFDCDGVIVETEELHRLAYNAAFATFGATVAGAPVDWTVPYYDKLQNTVGGGKPKMRHHFAEHGWPDTTAGPLAEAAGGAAPAPEAMHDRDALIDALQDEKTRVYKGIVLEHAVARPGVVALMDEALATPRLAVAICSAATRGGFETVVASALGPERLAKFDLILAGDDVDRKKPDPLIYNLASQRLGVSPSACLVIEDSMVGLRAAVGAGMRCVITPTASTEDQPFCAEGALAVVPALAGDLYRVAVGDLFVADGATGAWAVNEDIADAPGVEPCAVDYDSDDVAWQANPFAGTAM
jgi:HAD superfamily hydrolase (TIGR01509 family)